MSRLWPLFGRILSSSPIGFRVAQSVPSRLVSTGAISRSNYEGDGKTTVSFVDHQTGGFLMVEKMNRYGFQLSNGAFALGPIILFPTVIFRVRFIFLLITIYYGN